MQILIFELILVLFLLVVTVAVIFDTDLFACTLLFCVFSFGAVMTYLFFGSPDVAFTEAVIGTMSTVFFAVALKKIDRFSKESRHPIIAYLQTKREDAKKKSIARSARDRVVRIITFLALACICITFCIGSKYLPAIGDPSSAPNTHISNYYIEHSHEDTASENIVSGTLADYRGYDTMFETSVMFVSGLVVTLILFTGKDKTDPLHDIYTRRKKRGENNDEKEVSGS